MTNRHPRWWQRFPARGLVSALVYGGLILALTHPILVTPAYAEGTADLYPTGASAVGGVRARIRYQDNKPDQGLDRASSIDVYAEAGETILMGHSHFDEGGSADIEITDPVTGVTQNCSVNLLGNNIDNGLGAYGTIETRSQELAGPDLDTTDGGLGANYNPCVFNVANTGIHRVWMLPPNITAGATQAGTATDDDPAGGTDFAALDGVNSGNVFSLNAWDITVVNGGAAQTGRVYANVFVYTTNAFTNALNITHFVHTKDGHTYEFDFNGGQPFGFFFYANNKGILDTDNVTPLFKSAAGTDPNVHDPRLPDDDANNLISYKLFINEPSNALPASAKITEISAANLTTPRVGLVANQTTWLGTTPSVSPAPDNLVFRGNNNVKGLTEVGQGGTFSFTPNATGSVVLRLDLDDNGNFDDADDVTLQKSVIANTATTLTWDGKDGNGVDVPVGNVDVQIKTEQSVSETHFPAADVEQNPLGYKIKRSGSFVDVFFDDSSLNIAAGGIVAGVVNGVWQDPLGDNDPTKDLSGESGNGAHKWPGDNVNDGRGNVSTLDTWTRVLADSNTSDLRITVTNVGDDPTGEVLLSGTVWFDEDGDRVVDPGEDKFSNCTVNLLDSNGTIQQTTTTDSNGDYEFRAWDDFVNGDSYDVQFSCGALGQGTTVSGSNAGTTGNGSITGIQLFFGTEVTDQSLPLDPSGRFYDSETREPVAGVTVQLFANGALVPDACLAAGQQNQVTGTDGRYRFDIVDFGAGCPGATDYTIAFTVPTGYIQGESTNIPADDRTVDATNCTANGTAIDPVAGDPCRIQTQETVPTGAQSTLYFFTFSLAAGDENVIHNHIPLDPGNFDENTFFATKETSIVRTTRGSRVPYTMTFNNVSGSTVTNAVLRDTMPPGFKYVENTAFIDGVRTEPTVDGRELTWTGQNFAAGDTKTVEIILVVGSAVSDGAYTNITFAEDTVQTRLSNTAEATVIIIPDPLFDCTDIIGKVWDDQNGNAYQDKGEPGLPGVRLATVSGLRITTDYNGRYHIACADIPQRERGSNFIVKLDTNSLPSGYRMSTENPRVVRATRGKLIKANFGAALYRMVRLTVDERAYDGVKLTEHWAGVALPELLDKATGTERPAVIRIKYVNQPGEDRRTVDERVYQTVEAIKAIWSEKGRDYPLILEVEDVPELPVSEEVAK